MKFALWAHLFSLGTLPEYVWLKIKKFLNLSFSPMAIVLHLILRTTKLQVCHPEANFDIIRQAII